MQLVQLALNSNIYSHSCGSSPIIHQVFGFILKRFVDSFCIRICECCMWVRVSRQSRIVCCESHLNCCVHPLWKHQANKNSKFIHFSISMVCSIVSIWIDQFYLRIWTITRKITLVGMRLCVTNGLELLFAFSFSIVLLGIIYDLYLSFSSDTPHHPEPYTPSNTLEHSIQLSVKTAITKNPWNFWLK